VNVIKSRRLRWAGHIARMVGGRSAFEILRDKRRRRWEDNIRRFQYEELGCLDSG
jgi:hypothetical protein